MPLYCNWIRIICNLLLTLDFISYLPFILSNAAVIYLSHILFFLKKKKIDAAAGIYGTPVKKGDEREEVPGAMGMEPCEKEMLWA